MIRLDKRPAGSPQGACRALARWLIKMKRELETTRLLLRPCRTEDVELAYELWTNDHVRRFLFDDRIISMDEARLFVDASQSNFERHGYGLWLVFARERGCVVGFAGFLRTEGEAPGLIYGVHPDFCGKGYATEAARAVLSYALESLAVPVVKADVDEPNVISVRVLEKLGMRRTRRAIVAGRTLVYYEKSLAEGAD
jgi:RimJ/RimL family protein N-acetyltransferase